MVDAERLGARLDLDVDDREVFAALGRLDDLRHFAAAAQRAADERG